MINLNTKLVERIEITREINNQLTWVRLKKYNRCGWTFDITRWGRASHGNQYIICNHSHDGITEEKFNRYLEILNTLSDEELSEWVKDQIKNNSDLEVY